MTLKRLGIHLAGLVIFLALAQGVADCATISGTVRNSSGSTINGRTHGITVYAYRGNPCGYLEYTGESSVNASGSYAIMSMTPGTYYLLASNAHGSEYLDEWWASPASTQDCSGAQAVLITGYAQVVTGRDFQLDLGGTISGTLYQSDGTTPLAGVSIEVEAFLGSPCGTRYRIGWAQIDPIDGTYSIKGLPLGTYFLWSYNLDQSDYINAWWASPASTPECSGAQAVEISSLGQAITGKDFQLDLGGSISGRVYQGDGATPITGLVVDVSLWQGDPCGNNQLMAEAYTNPNDGTYVLRGVPVGTYYLWSHNLDQSDYLNAWWASPASTPECSGAQVVEISNPGEAVTGKDFRLYLGGSISGTVYQGDGTTPLTGTSVQINAMWGSPCGTSYGISQAQTNPSDGTYLMRGVPLATYSLLSSDLNGAGYLSEWWASPASTPFCNGAQEVTLSTEGQAVTGKDFQLESGGTISGQVFGELGPIGGASIRIYAGPCGQTYMGGTQTDEDGNYSVSALPPGDVYVRASGPSHSNYVDLYYDGGDGATDVECGFATPVKVLSGGITAGIDFHLEKGDKRVQSNQVIVHNGELTSFFSVQPGFRDLVASATLSMPNLARGVFIFSLEEDDLLQCSECIPYLAYWSKRFGSVVAADYGTYNLTVAFKDGVQEVCTWELREATVVPVSNITVTVYDDGSALVSWDRNTSNPYSYQVRVSDGTQDVYRSDFLSSIFQLAIPADDLRCLEIGRTYHWQVRVYDRDPATGSYNRVESVEIESLYAPSSLNSRVTEAGVCKYSGTLTLYFDVRPGSRDHVKAACVTGPLSYCFNMDEDYIDLSTETRLYRGWFKQNAAWPIVNGTYTFTIDFDDDLDGTKDHTEVVTSAFSADNYTPVAGSTMEALGYPDGSMDFTWGLSETPGLNYQVAIRSLDGSQEYYGSTEYPDGFGVTASFYDLRGMKRGRMYQWFVRAWSADGDTMELSAVQEFYYDPAPGYNALTATFNENSALITNPYMPFRAGDKLIYAGIGMLEGHERHDEALGTERVDGVNCLKLVVKVMGGDPEPGLDSDWVYVWFAQDAEGNVWLLQLYESATGQRPISGRAQAVLWMPATPLVGTTFRQMGEEYRQVTKSGLEVNLGTGLGSYSSCLRLVWTDLNDLLLEYLATGVGLVKTESSEGLSGWELKQILRAKSSRNELVLNLGLGHGLYHYDQSGSWKQWNTVNPSQMVTVDLNGDGMDEMVAAFPGYGLYKKDSANDWQRINNVDPEMMIAADIDGDGKEKLVAGFEGYGLYFYDDAGGWSPPINDIIPDAMVRYTDGVVCDFGKDYGLWSYNTSRDWFRLNPEDPDQIVAADIDGDGEDELVVSFVGWGLYTYEQVGGKWQQVNPVVPHKTIAVDMDRDGSDELVASFHGYGLYTYEAQDGAWDPINTEIPEAMIRLGNGVAVDYGAAYGLWVWSQEGGWQQRNTVDPGQMTSVDMDNDGVEELVVCFSGYGLYYFDETEGWQLLNDVVPEDMKSINFYP